MVSDIKFRVWDKKESEWLASSDPNSLTYYGFTLFGDVMSSQTVPPEFFSDIVIMRFTGLKDKNGKDIYEGDILKIDVPDGGHVFGCIEYLPEMTSFVAVNGDDMYLFGGQSRSSGKEWRSDIRANNYVCSMVEVIGDIYSNPDMMRS